MKSNAFRNTWDVGKWTVEYPEQWRLSDSNNCGVLVCTMAEMEVRDKWTSMKNEVIQGEDLWYLRRYHASSMAAYAVQHMTYTRTVEEVGKKGICSIVSDTEIQDLFRGIVKGSLKPMWNKWWQTKTGKMAKPKSFHPALSAHVEELLGHIDNIVFTKKKDEKLEHFDLIMSELIPESSSAPRPTNDDKVQRADSVCGAAPLSLPISVTISRPIMPRGNGASTHLNCII
ncbi:hypothetical protein R3I93_006151 [Phoxinus phoxinus]|uniref:Uncharacterized protein n=1 Tax=Phoxinus phoxinus TaxID=58324 RepID=A0AAN9DCI3_9TELE